MSEDFTLITDQAALNELLTGDAVAAMLMQKGLQVETTAKRLCPVDTGRLRASIDSQLAQDGEGLMAIIGTNVDYAPHVEFGTSRMGARSFLRAALEQQRGAP